MDDEPTPYEELGPVQRSTCGSTPSVTSKPSAQTRHLISELGLRYRPSVQADLAEHAAQLALLARDVAGVDPRDLDYAIKEHVKTSPFMPKACELLALAETGEKIRIYRERQKIPALPGPRLLTAQELFDAWAGRLKHETVPQDEIDDKPDRWRRIAYEQGYLRRVDGKYTQRAQFMDAVPMPNPTPEDAR